MSNTRLLLDDTDPDAPLRGDWIAHIGPDEEENGLWSQVQTLESSDRSEGVYEVLDEFKTRMYIERKDDHWIQTYLR